MNSGSCTCSRVMPLLNWPIAATLWIHKIQNGWHSLTMSLYIKMFLLLVKGLEFRLCLIKPNTRLLLHGGFLKYWYYTIKIIVCQTLWWVMYNQKEITKCYHSIYQPFHSSLLLVPSAKPSLSHSNVCTLHFSLAFVDWCPRKNPKTLGKNLYKYMYVHVCIRSRLCNKL